MRGEVSRGSHLLINFGQAWGVWEDEVEGGIGLMKTPTVKVRLPTALPCE